MPKAPKKNAKTAAVKSLAQVAAKSIKKSAAKAAAKAVAKPKKSVAGYQRILCPIDIADKSPRTYEAKILNEMRRNFGATLFLMAVLPDYAGGYVAQYFTPLTEDKLLEDARKALQAYAKKYFDKPQDIKVMVKQGGIYEQIIDTAREVKADVIVMAAHRPQLKNYLLGPNAAKVVRHSEISVLVLREK